tara:strand:- start:507 stop:749 length:243 start_codon:yes stop_codon:yes gene_type:complete
MKTIAVGSLVVLCSLGITAAKVTSDLPEIERDARALELYLQDREDYEKYCPFRTWEQPPISVYKQTLISHLPEGCLPNND